ncbi:hypothetical protein [Massilia sp. 9096]|uniref:hypothetical protein n=1 Tax=Massilia sp. 9096 TaxID=1500894 RepID=UPI000564ACC0|nr:hypothetical protein [Massilia sp. 9096]
MTAKRLARQLVKTIALRGVAFVVARPRLDEFLRRQLYRFPGLAGRARAAVARSRRADWQTLPVLLADEAELSESARQVLQDLRRALERTRTP